MTLRSIAKRILPVRVYQKLRDAWRGVFIDLPNYASNDMFHKQELARNYKYDLDRFARHSTVCANTTDKSNQREHLKAVIVKQYHMIEKGLALPAPRLGFGGGYLPELVKNCDIYVKAYGCDETIQVTTNALRAYLKFHEGKSLPHWASDVCEFVSRADGAGWPGVEGGVRSFTKQEWLRLRDESPVSFLTSRCSMRHFSDEPVNDEIIEQAVVVAQKAPSVCNRQTCRVYDVSKSQKMLEYLSHQGGSTGFSENIARVLIVTSDLRLFTSAGERNQGWIDGGMFAMQLLLALHALGLGACALNWSTDHKRDSRFRAVSVIPDHEIIMMFIAVGHLKDEFRVAQSPRRPLSEVFVKIE